MVAVLGITLNVHDCISISNRPRHMVLSLAYLLILELDQVSVVLDDLVAFVLAVLEQLRKSEPLSSHLVAVIGVDKLVIVNAVRSVTLHASNGRLAAVQSDDIVNQSLALRAELDGLGGVGGVVLRCRGLADFKLLSWLARHVCGLLVDYGSRMDERSLGKTGDCSACDGSKVCEEHCRRENGST